MDEHKDDDNHPCMFFFLAGGGGGGIGVPKKIHTQKFDFFCITLLEMRSLESKNTYISIFK